MVMDANVYLQWLFPQCEAKDIDFEITHVNETVHLHSSSQKSDVAINWTGLMASEFGVVENSTVYAARGQLCIVRNNFEGLFATCRSDDGPLETTTCSVECAVSSFRFRLRRSVSHGLAGGAVLGIHIESMTGTAKWIPSSLNGL